MTDWSRNYLKLLRYVYWTNTAFKLFMCLVNGIRWLRIFASTFLLLQIVLDHCVERSSRDDSDPNLMVNTKLIYYWTKYSINNDKAQKSCRYSCLMWFLTFQMVFDYQYLDPGPEDESSKSNRYFAMNVSIIENTYLFMHILTTMMRHYSL